MRCFQYLYNLILFILGHMQVVSPEFTFYDGSKLSSDSSLQVEKLLRAKMDLSFMYELYVHYMLKLLCVHVKVYFIF